MSGIRTHRIDNRQHRIDHQIRPVKLDVVTGVVDQLMLASGRPRRFIILHLLPDRPVLGTLRRAYLRLLKFYFGERLPGGGNSWRA